MKIIISRVTAAWRSHLFSYVHSTETPVGRCSPPLRLPPLGTRRAQAPLHFPRARRASWRCQLLSELERRSTTNSRDCCALKRKDRPILILIFREKKKESFDASQPDEKSSDHPYLCRRSASIDEPEQQPPFSHARVQSCAVAVSSADRRRATKPVRAAVLQAGRSRMPRCSRRSSSRIKTRVCLLWTT